MTAPTLLAVCVDDFGMHGGVNDAALALGGAGRATAVSCMVDGPAWRSGAGPLRQALAGKADIGLHLDLTEQRPGRPRRALPALIVAAYARRLSSRDMASELRRQLDAFEDAAGAAPDFVNGHQHVHQLPVIREALVAELLRRYRLRRPWLRNSLPPPCRHGFALKPYLIGMLGGAALSALAKRAGLRQNRRLLGVYGYAGSPERYRRHVRQWLAQALSECLARAVSRGAVAPRRAIKRLRHHRVQLIRAEASFAPQVALQLRT